MTKVIKADASAGLAYATFNGDDTSGNIRWITLEMLLTAASLDLYTGTSSGNYINFAQMGTFINKDYYLEDPDYGGVWAGDSELGTVPTPVPDSYMVVEMLFDYDAGNNSQLIVNGTPSWSVLLGGGPVFDGMLLGIHLVSPTDPLAVIYYKSVKIGTTQGGTEKFEWNGIDLSQFDSVTGDVTVVDDTPIITSPDIVIGGMSLQYRPERLGRIV